MLHEVDKRPTDRQRWMKLAAQAPLAMLESGLIPFAHMPYSWLRRPETGLFMVRARIGGTGAKFNLGEITVTRCVLRLGNGVSGVAYVQGRSHRHAALAALADALMQMPAVSKALQFSLVDPIERLLAADADAMQRKAQATRVEFLTVARDAAA